MHNKRHISILRTVALLLVLTLTLPMAVDAATVQPVQPLASAYWSRYDAYIEPLGDGKIQICLEARSLRTFSMIGAKTVKLYHSIDSQTWYLVDTYTYDTTSGMMSYSTNSHTGHIDFDGIPGRFYKATVTFYGSYGGTTESFDFYTETLLST